jgi:sulfane dehydrogenase subunit SoxC
MTLADDQRTGPTQVAPRFSGASPSEAVAGGGLLSRRAVLTGAVVAGALSAVPARAGKPDWSEAAKPWQKQPGRPFSRYGQPSVHVKEIERSVTLREGDVAPGNGSSFTPLHLLRGTLTPNGLHFERHHNGVPDIDPDHHRLVIHGLVDRPLRFDFDALLRYPMVSRTVFIECSGNSFRNTFPKVQEVPCGDIHGLISTAEWTGVPLSTLLAEAGVRAQAKWVIAEGADAATMARSIPLAKALDDVLVAFYQNGEPLRPEQGFPMRLVLPGYEGNMSIKWVHRLELTEVPLHARDETSHYTDLLPDGRALQFTFPMGVKSVITQPSAGWDLQGPGYYDVSGLAWTGAGRVTKVEVSADGGATWAEAELQGTPPRHGVVRFRIPWRWDGKPTTLASRATDETGAVQPDRATWIARYGATQRYHYNAIQHWAVDAEGRLRNVYA